MKTYGELDLKKIREEADLDFAHFTYKKGQCSCCYTPKDLPKRYWKNGIIREDNDYEFILFKNAYNGSGTVTKNDYIKDYTCISWDFPMEKMQLVCDLLQEQLGDDYFIEIPKSQYHCIVIRADIEDVKIRKREY